MKQGNRQDRKTLDWLTASPLSLSLLVMLSQAFRVWLLSWPPSFIWIAIRKSAIDASLKCGQMRKNQQVRHEVDCSTQYWDSDDTQSTLPCVAVPFEYLDSLDNTYVNTIIFLLATSDIDVIVLPQAHGRFEHDSVLDLVLSGEDQHRERLVRVIRFCLWWAEMSLIVKLSVNDQGKIPKAPQRTVCFRRQAFFGPNA